MKQFKDVSSVVWDEMRDLDLPMFTMGFDLNATIRNFNLESGFIHEFYNG